LGVRTWGSLGFVFCFFVSCESLISLLRQHGAHVNVETEKKERGFDCVLVESTVQHGWSSIEYATCFYILQMDFFLFFVFFFDF
jgi:hypothetical protein